MERKSIIAVVAGSAGILMAATVAGVAVVNAADSGTVAEPASVVAAQPLTPNAVVEPSPWSGSTESMPLPEIVIPSSGATGAQGSPITANQARSAAVKAADGNVLGTQRVQHAGYDAYAVQIERADGSIVTGYVEASTGVVYDWVVNQAAPAPQAAYEDDDDDEKYEDDDEKYEDDHDDEDHDDDDDD